MNDLTEELKAEYDRLMAEGRSKFNPSDIQPSVDLILKAWDLLPDKKEDYQESFEIMNSLTHIYFNLGRFEEAKKWAEVFLHCNPTRNYGEQEFMYAKVAFELGDLDKARKYFEIADKKSEGRFWKHKDTMKYFKFFKEK